MIARLVIFIASSVVLFPSFGFAQDGASPVVPVRDPRATTVVEIFFCQEG